MKKKSKKKTDKDVKKRKIEIKILCGTCNQPTYCYVEEGDRFEIHEFKCPKCGGYSFPERRARLASTGGGLIEMYCTNCGKRFVMLEDYVYDHYDEVECSDCGGDAVASDIIDRKLYE